MVEQMTAEEAVIQRAIRAARLAKQVLLEGDNDQLEYEPMTEDEKLTRPKAEDGEVEVENAEDTHSGYGLAGKEDDYSVD